MEILPTLIQHTIDKIREIINTMDLSSAIRLHPIQLTNRESQLYALMTLSTTNNNMCNKDIVTLTFQ